LDRSQSSVFAGAICWCYVLSRFIYQRDFEIIVGKNFLIHAPAISLQNSKWSDAKSSLNFSCSDDFAQLTPCIAATYLKVKAIYFSGAN